MGKKKDLSPPEKREIEVLLRTTEMNAREIAISANVSAQSVERIKRKIELNEPVSPSKRKNFGFNLKYIKIFEKFLIRCPTTVILIVRL